MCCLLVIKPLESFPNNVMGYPSANMESLFVFYNAFSFSIEKIMSSSGIVKFRVTRSRMVISLPREKEIGRGCWMVQGESLRTDEGDVFTMLHMDLIPWTTYSQSRCEILSVFCHNYKMYFKKMTGWER